MPWQAPTLTSRNGIERRNAVEAQSPIKPTVRSQRRSRVGNHRVHLGRLGHRQQATELVRQRVQTELVEALTPVCVDKFNRASDAPARLLELKKVASWWDRERFVRDNDRAKFGKELNSRVGGACAVQLTSFNPKLAISWI